jgi:hypothetical protein
MHSINARRMISGLVLNHLKGLGRGHRRTLDAALPHPKPSCSDSTLEGLVMDHCDP